MRFGSTGAFHWFSRPGNSRCLHIAAIRVWRSAPNPKAASSTTSEISRYREEPGADTRLSMGKFLIHNRATCRSNTLTIC